MKKKTLVGLFSFFSLLILFFLLASAFLFTSPLKSMVEIEAGEDITDLNFYKNPAFFSFLKKNGMSPANIKMLSEKKALFPETVGEYPIQFLVNGKNRSSILRVKDTKIPELSVSDVVIPSGDKVGKEDFILSLMDATKTEVGIRGLELYQKKKQSGVYEVEIEAIDDGKNRAVRKAKLYALPLKRKARVELGEKEIRAEVFIKNRREIDFSLDFKQGFHVDSLLTGEGVYKVPLSVKMDEIEKIVELKLEVKDTKPPVFSGIEEMNLLLGEQVSYRSGVSVQDNQLEKIDFSVDASKVNLKKEGSYPIFYMAKDHSGNETRIKRMINVLSSEKSHIKEVREFVTETLSALITETMSEKEKLKQIYDFCHSIRYVGSSEKGDIIEAAYQGFKTKTGDCFTYYAMASVLLSEAGFSEKMVSREGGTGRHYWNLVKSGEAWYHFDSCPIADSGDFEPFMVSDEELIVFSNNYSKRYPERKGYYNFNRQQYPERGKKAFENKE